ncbi:MAG TPA: hypothetical protein VH008_22420 [Pseudonocardia sp.]|nr:hypothetical protein [Pseudonocardia sp.]
MNATGNTNAAVTASTNATTVTVNVSAYLPEGRQTPGRLAAVPLEVRARGENELVLPEVTVRDERSLTLLDAHGTGDLLPAPLGGGGPGRDVEQDREARLFGLTNVAFHSQRMLRTVAELLGHELPHLVIRIGTHESPRRWGGGHYRVTAGSYDPVEAGSVRPTGEVHLGGGSTFVPTAPDGEGYFAAPSHNLAIIYHEIGHHVCRHTADFRLNRLLPAAGQTNKKIPLDEGTCDFLAATLLDTPDIYGWHRAAIPTWDRRRRALAARWTMAGFEGGPSDPHVDGTIWASACWTAREHVAAAGHGRSSFDRMLLRGLELSSAPWTDSSRTDGLAGRAGEARRTSLALKQRRYVANLLDAMLRAEPELAVPVLAGMAEHGIRPGASNVELRRAASVTRLTF